MIKCDNQNLNTVKDEYEWDKMRLMMVKKS